MKLPLGYLYSATYAGIRQAEKDDLALVGRLWPSLAAQVGDIKPGALQEG